MNNFNCYITTELNVRGFDCSVTVYGLASKGGSNRWGSNEPEWVDCELVSICNDRGKEVSDRLWNAIINEHEDYLIERLLDERE